MNLKDILVSNHYLQTLVHKSAIIICIAIAFECISWWLGRRVEKLTAPLITADAEREPTWRIRRRTVLRQTPKLITRTLCYTVAAIMVFDLFGVPVLSLSIAIGAVAAVCGAALLPVLRDLGQGYALLGEDAIAVGDVVEINGHTGVVEKFTLRHIRLRDASGRTHHVSNRNLTAIVVHQRKVGEQGYVHDPLATPAPKATPAPRPPAETAASRR